jgi:serine O-acetyltransferase
MFWSEIVEDAKANLVNHKLSPLNFLGLCVINSGFQLLMLFRMQKRLRRYGFVGRALGLLLQKLAINLTACHVSPKAQISGGIYLPHATGIVIGADVVIEKGVSIYQHVTVGRRKDKEGAYPKLRENCTIYAGAQVLGDVVVGVNAVVGANAVVLSSVPDDAVAVGIPAIIKEKNASQN